MTPSPTPDHQHHWEPLTIVECGSCGAPIPCLLCGGLLTTDASAYCLACTDLLDSVDLDYAEERAALYAFMQAVLIGARLAGQVGPAAHAVARAARGPWLALRRAEGYVDPETSDDDLDPEDLGSLGDDLTVAELHPAHARPAHGWLYTASGWHQMNLTAPASAPPPAGSAPQPRAAAPAPVSSAAGGPSARVPKAPEQIYHAMAHRKRQPKRT